MKDPLADWRPEAPWSDVEERIYREFLERWGHDARAAYDAILAAALQGIELSLQSLAARLSIARHGEEHPDTLASLRTLAISCGRDGDLEQAERLHKWLWLFHRRTFGERHPATLSALDLFASFQDKLNDRLEALQLYELLLELCRSEFGEEHSETGQARYKLGVLKLRLKVP